MSIKLKVIKPRKGEFEREARKLVRKQFEELVRKAMSGITCPEHHEHPRVTIVDSAEGPVANIEGCCQNLIDEARRVLEPPTSEMEKEAVSAGYYHSPGYNRNYRRIQILTIDELLHGHQVDMPHEVGTFRQAPKAAESGAVQGQLEI